VKPVNHPSMGPDQALDVEPAADRNVVCMTGCCLDVEPKSAYILEKGSGGGTWWMIGMGMMLFVLDAFTSFMYENSRAGIPAFLGICATAVSGFGISLLRPIHIWEPDLPLCCTRNTRKVYFHSKGKNL
jgi:hypothetical protein